MRSELAVRTRRPSRSPARAALAAAVLCAAALAAPGCGEGEARFEIDLPTDWTKASDTPDALLALAPADGPTEGFRECLTVTRHTLSGPLALDEFARRMQDAIAEKLQQHEEIDRTTVQVDGAGEVVRVLGQHRRRGVTLRTLTQYAMRDRTGFVLTAITSEKEWADQRETLQQIAGSFRVMP